jgi:hypothetical protein
MVAALVALLGVVGSYHTITFDAATDAEFYRVYVQASRDFRPFLRASCVSSPCQIWLRKPAPGNVFWVSVVGVNAAGEGPH